LLILGFIHWRSSIKSPEDAGSVAKPEPVSVVERGAEEGLFAFATEHDPNDKTLRFMRQQAMRLAKAMDDPMHPCNPLHTSKAKITGLSIKPLSKGDKIYTIWLSDGVTTCGLDALHSEGRHPEILEGDFLRRFYLKDLEGGFAYNRQLLSQAMSPDKKPLSKSAIGEAVHNIVFEACGEVFFENTLPQQYGGFSISDGYNLTESSLQNNGRLHYTRNVVRASLQRTDMPQANPFDMTIQSKMDLYIQAEPPDSPLSFKVVYIDVSNNGFNPARYGQAGNPSGRNAAPLPAIRFR
jgi:hypothetical protein